MSSPVASFKHFAPIFRAAFFKNVIQPRADFLVVGVITRLRRLMQDFARDVIVQLKLKHGRERVVVIVSRVIVDVRLGRGIAKFFAALVTAVRRPGNRRRISTSARSIDRAADFRVNVRFPMRHHAAREINERNRARERVIEKKRRLVRP